MLRLGKRVAVLLLLDAFRLNPEVVLNIWFCDLQRCPLLVAYTA
jgi:hypothetical protein